MIRFALILCLLLLCTGIALQNRSTFIEITYIAGQSFSLSLSRFFIISTLLGAILASILIVPGWVRTQREVKRQKQKMERMQDELAHLRTQIHIQGPPPYTPLKKTVKNEIDEP